MNSTLLNTRTSFLKVLADSVVDVSNTANVGAAGVQMAGDAGFGARAERVLACGASLAEHARVFEACFLVCS